MKKKLHAFIVLICLTIILIFGKSTTVNAVTLDTIKQSASTGESFYVSGSDMENNTGYGFIYCVNHGDGHEMQGYYKTLVHVNIEGNTATSNGNTVTNTLNGILAYTLSAGSYPTGYVKYFKGLDGTRQLAVWEIFATSRSTNWMSMVGNQITSNVFTWNSATQASVWETSKNKLLTEANSYAESIEASGAEIKVTQGQGITTDNTFAGPFEVECSGEMSYKVYTESGEDVTNSVQIVDSSGNSINISSGQEFYIKNDTGKKINKITVETGSIEVYCADLYFIGGAKNTSSYTMQYMMAVDTYKKNKSGSADITFGSDTNEEEKKEEEDDDDDETHETDTPTTGVIVHKIDSDGSGHGVEGASFTLYHHNYYRVYTMHYYTLETGWDYYWKTVWEYDEDGKVTGSHQEKQWYSYKYYEEHTQKLSEVKNYKYTPNSSSGHSTWYSLDRERDIWEAEGSGTTDKNGYASLGTVDTGQNGEYTECYVEETNIPPGYQSAVEPIKYFSVSSSGETTIELKNVKNKTTVTKLDIDTKESLSGIKFELYSGNKICKFLTDSPDGYYNYDKYSGTTTIEAKNGKLLLGRLPAGTYKLKEIETKEEYELYILKGDENPYMPLAVSGQLKDEYEGIPANGEVTIYNKKKMSISGYVWEDQSQGKVDNNNGGYDSQYNSGEQRINGVTVILKDKSGSEVARTTTDSNGEYIFENIIYHEDYNDYYVEFSYSNLFSGETRYIPVALGESLGLCDTIDGHDRDVPSTATTDKNGLSNITYNESTNTLGEINLGLKKLAPSSFTVKESIEYIEIKINGYTQRYYINSDEDPGTTVAGITTVQVQDAKDEDTYTHKLYPSEMVYDKLSIENTGEEKLIVDVIYRIDITNTTTTRIDELYRESYLDITSLINTFDSRFVLADSKWKSLGSNSAYLYDCDEVSGIEPNGTKKTNIRLRLTKEAKQEIMVNPNGVPVKESTVVEAEGYHIYNRKEYGWSYNTTKDPNSHQTFTNYAKAKAQYINFQLGEERTIKGTVFEDTNVREDTNEVVGNGIYEDRENNVSGVKVELVEIDETYSKTVSELSPTTLYGVNKSGDSYLTGQDAITMTQAQTYTDSNGEYSLTGMIPGEYYLRFTYGNGTQKITDGAGNEIEFKTKIKDKETQEEKDVSTEDYKSTIVSVESALKALKAERGEEEDIDATKKDKDDKSWQWYKPENLQVTDANIAVDDLDYENGEFVSAGSPRMSIGIENTTGRTVPLEDVQIETIEGMNFGIILKPIKSVEYEKLITNVWIRNGQDSKIIDGNPATAKETGMSNLDPDHVPDGSVFVRVELPEDQIYSSTVVLTYRIKVTNTSDVDYYNKYYSWFGEADENCESTLIVDEGYDYFDTKMNISGELPEDLTLLEYKRNKWVDEAGNEYADVQGAPKESEEKYQQILLIHDEDKLYTIKNTKRTKSVKTDVEYVFRTENRLPTEEDDMDFVNIATIKKVINSNDDDDNKYSEDEAEQQISFKRTPGMEPDEVQATLTITPPTGENGQLIVIYTIAIITALVITATGLIFIKKKVL